MVESVREFGVELWFARLEGGGRSGTQRTPRIQALAFYNRKVERCLCNGMLPLKRNERIEVRGHGASYRVRQSAAVGWALMSVWMCAYGSGGCVCLGGQVETEGQFAQGTEKRRYLETLDRFMGDGSLSFGQRMQLPRERKRSTGNGKTGGGESFHSCTRSQRVSG